ncbi:MAG: hypothetical protein AB7F31_07630 [Parachlamydiales bacterium]
MELVTLSSGPVIPPLPSREPTFHEGALKAVGELGEALKGGSYERARQYALALVDIGETILSTADNRRCLSDKRLDFRPIANGLMEILKSADYESQDDLKGILFRATRLFMSMTFVKYKEENRLIGPQQQKEWRSTLKERLESQRQRDTDLHIELHYLNLLVGMFDCGRESVRELWGSYLENMGWAAQGIPVYVIGPSFSVASLAYDKLVPLEWIKVHSLHWYCTQLKYTEEEIAILSQKVAPHFTQDPTAALAYVHFLEQVVLQRTDANGTAEVISGLQALEQGCNWSTWTEWRSTTKSWQFRYALLKVLVELTKHGDHFVRYKAELALSDYLERNGSEAMAPLFNRVEKLNLSKGVSLRLPHWEQLLVERCKRLIGTGVAEWVYDPKFKSRLKWETVNWFVCCRPQFPNLSHLEIVGSQCEPDKIRKIVAAMGKRLTRLNVSHNALGKKGLLALLPHLVGGPLTALNLQANELDAAAIESAAELLNGLTALKSLNLNGNKITYEETQKALNPLLSRLAKLKIGSKVYGQNDLQPLLIN